MRNRTMTKHTPGPWTRKNNVVYGADGFGVLELQRTGNSEEMGANGAIVEAAPELLEALKEALPRLRKQYHDTSDSKYDAAVKSSRLETINLVEKAIAKAEGRVS
jgi:hypothetical protein